MFPAKTMCAHVNTWNKNSSVKFRTAVAMMCKLGFDIKLADMSKDCLLYTSYTAGYYDRPDTAICLETQFYPDTPSHSDFPSCLVLPEKAYEPVSYTHLVCC